MADKRSSDKSQSIPKKPPKRPSRDYANLPQRPITLKKARKKTSVKKKKQPEIKARHAPAPKKKVTAKKTIPRVKKQSLNQWLLKGVSEETKQYALDEANHQGVTIGEWIEQLILDYQESEYDQQNEPVETDIPQQQDEIVAALYAIEQRLDRIEDQRGFWARFWEQVMKQDKSNKA
ncbi:MAG: hypothetical protein ABW092_06625 [Candidatus Thiodiazotropha sp.]